MGPPRSGIVDTLRPTFEWVATDYDCAIQGYRVRLSSAGDERSALVTSGSTWTPESDLMPASMYSWQIAAVASDGSEGPASPMYYFFTGPLCSESQTRMVRLVSPAAGETVTYPNPPLTWSYPLTNCIPEGYDFTVWDVAEGRNALHGHGSPGTSFETGISFLQDCRLFYWWVQPIIGGSVSPNYVPSYFVTDFTGTCPGAPCDASTLLAPQPVAPENGSAWNEISATVSWTYEYPVCLPNITFHAQIARDPDFDRLIAYSDSIHWLSFNPAAAFLDDCTTYYWRVAAETGTRSHSSANSSRSTSQSPSVRSSSFLFTTTSIGKGTKRG